MLQIIAGKLCSAQLNQNGGEQWAHMISIGLRQTWTFAQEMLCNLRRFAQDLQPEKTNIHEYLRSSDKALGCNLRLPDKVDQRMAASYSRVGLRGEVWTFLRDSSFQTAQSFLVNMKARIHCQLLKARAARVDSHVWNSAKLRNHSPLFLTTGHGCGLVNQ